jgi:hypothetical protein
MRDISFNHNPVVDCLWGTKCLVQPVQTSSQHGVIVLTQCFDRSTLAVVKIASHPKLILPHSSTGAPKKLFASVIALISSNVKFLKVLQSSSRAQTCPSLVVI